MKTAEDIAMTKECIMASLFELMAEKKYADITITEVAKKAGFGRATFYRHFQTKEDVIQYYFIKQQDMFDDIARFKSENKDDYYEIVFRIFATLKDHKHILRLIAVSGLETVYLDYLNKALIRHFKVNGYPEIEYLPYLFAGSLFNVSMRWIKNNCAESVKCIADLYYECTFNLNVANSLKAQSG